MSYYNSKIYNYDNLKEEDKDRIDFFDYAIESVENYVPIEWEDVEGKTILEKLTQEIQEKYKKELLEQLDCDRMECIVGIMDNYEEDYELPSEKEEEKEEE